MVEELERQGLKRGENGLNHYDVRDPIERLAGGAVPRVLRRLLHRFERHDQLALGLDRDSVCGSELFDERNDAVKALLSMAIRAAKKQGKYVGICGQGPSDHEDFAAWLMEGGLIACP